MKSYYWKIFSNNPFHATDLFPLKKSEIQRFSGVFRWYSKRPAGWNGLIRLAHYTLRCSRKYQTFPLTFYAKLALELDQDLFFLRNLIVLLPNLDLKLYNWPPRQKREGLKTNSNFSGWISNWVLIRPEGHWQPCKKVGSQSLSKCLVGFAGNCCCLVAATFQVEWIFPTF